MKLYLMTNEKDLILFFITIIICSLVILSLGKIYRNKKIIKVICIFFYLYCFFILLDSLLNILPFAPDSSVYTSLIQGTQDINKVAKGYKSFYYLSYIINFLSFKVMGAYLVYNTLIMFIGVYLIMLAYEKYVFYLDKKVKICYLIFSLCYPSIINYSTAPLRESYTLFFLGLFLYSIYSSKKFFLLIGSCGLFLLREEYIIFILLFIFYRKIELKMMRKYNKKIKIVLLILLTIIFFVIAYYLINLSEIKINPQEMGAIRNGQIERHGNLLTYPKVIWNSYFDILIDSFLLILQFLLSPIPILYENTSQIGLFMWLDSFYLIGIYILFLLNLFNKKALSWKLMILTFIITNSIYEYFITGAVRHRMLIMPMIFIISAEYLVKILKKKKKVIKNEKILIVSEN